MISRMLATAFTAIFLLVSAAGVGAAPLYTLDFLPAGFTGVQLNNAGQVVGRAGNAAALYSGGVVTGVAPAASYGWGINNLGDVTGALNTNAANEAFTNIGGALVNIHPLVAGPNVESTGIAINDAGVVGGNIYAGGESNLGFVLRDGVVEHIATFGGDYSTLTAINNSGVATGYAAFEGPAGGNYHAYIYQDGTLQDLGTLAGTGNNSAAADINDLGQVAGRSGASPFLYSGGSMINLGNFGGANALNDAGVVVGYAYFTPGPGDIPSQAFVYAGNGMVDLNTLVDPVAGWSLTDALDINAAGQILGTACQGGTCASVLLTPVPEPAAGLMLLAGLVPLAARVRRRLA